MAQRQLHLTVNQTSFEFVGSSPTTPTQIVLSSNGRTSDFDSDCGGSNPSGTTIGFLAQWIRAFRYGRKGWGFESLRDH